MDVSQKELISVHLLSVWGKKADSHKAWKTIDYRYVPYSCNIEGKLIKWF